MVQTVTTGFKNELCKILGQILQEFRVDIPHKSLETNFAMVVNFVAVEHPVTVVITDLNEKVNFILESSSVCNGHAFDVLLPIDVAFVLDL